MNNRYIFRGKRKDNGKWVYGGIYYQKADEVKEEAAYIIGGSLNNVGVAYEVIPDTVGQYTGLKDKKGRRIFEGDIVHAVYKSGYTGIPDKDFGIGVIKYSATYYGGAAYQVDLIGEPGCRIFSASLQVEVIGNIHENPELLKGE